MRWGDFRRSDNVEDRGDAGASGGGMPGGGIKLTGGVVVVVVVASLLFGVNPLEMLAMLSGDGGPVTQPQPQQQAPAPGYGPAPRPAVRDESKEMVARVLGDTEDVWGAVFKQQGSRYDAPKLVLFRGATQSACGRASTAVGPFYCPADREVYLDTAFFNELTRRFGAPGDFAQAYVVAHEVGHHVQNLMGIMGQFDKAAQRTDARGPQRAVGAARTAGRLLRRRLGPLRAEAQPPRARGRRRGAARGGRGRRRPHPARRAGPGGPGVVHARLGRTAQALVRRRPRERRRAQVRHLRHAHALTREPAAARGRNDARLADRAADQGLVAPPSAWKRTRRTLAS